MSAASPALAGSMAGRLLLADAAGLPPPPFPSLVGSEPGSFAEATITARLPAILASMLSDIRADAAERGWTSGPEAAQVEAALAELAALRQSLLEDAPLPQLTCAPDSPAQTVELLAAANAAVALAAARQAAGQQAQPGGGAAAARPSWLGLPWLLVECYMYAAIHAALQRQPLLAAYDPFGRQKAAGWAKSAAAAADVAAEAEALLAALHASSSATTPSASSTSAAPSAQETSGPQRARPQHEAAARAAALGGVLCALWGNKADLSLLVSADGLSAEDLAGPSGAQASGPSGGGEAEGGPARVIVDDSAAVWGRMAHLRAGTAGPSGLGPGGARVDLVLDNSGLELFADLCLADLLLEAGVASHVVLHGKAIPWFVSDTLAGDLGALLDSCEAQEAPGKVPPGAWEPVRRLAARWRGHLAAGRWSWRAHAFWTTPAPFAWMAHVAPDLYDGLSGSALVILKGDLNYRKLTHDCRWPHTTPFAESLQGFRPAPLVALRTLKADVVAGLAPGQSAALSAADPHWLVNGRWGMVQAAL
ncbi:hypothetical protein HYH03_010471 [Edaphochlamys debaryana]|uniref:Sugar phosphate phosphatase n=1 Tax=Edaphochlamys debaryana TaxID=47281 RepID=A0A835XW35_9CHLO|nr:hypothetical protein HYH03_010471 [Edaphochlamys debaryana]|eukprot:KAG2491266.1 hypothetical protein HYH03_010471 [Edaphochlamys debaryana]